MGKKAKEEADAKLSEAERKAKEEAEKKAKEEADKKKKEEEDDLENLIINLENEVADMFRAISKEAHWSDPDELSRTLFIVDQQLNYIEQILGEFHDVMEANDLIAVA